MKRYLVEVSYDALRDLEDIYDYIKNDLGLPKYAEQLLNKIEKSFKSLEYLPRKYSKIESKMSESLELRRIIVDRYIVIYSIEFETVLVLKILYGPSNRANHIYK